MIPIAVLAVALAGGWAPSTDEGSLRVLTSDPAADDYWPCFSPDGETVLFARSLDGRKTWNLFVIPTAGGTARRLAQVDLPVSASRPSWSWRHDTIAFTGEDAEGVAAAWTIDPAGRKAERVQVEGLSKRVSIRRGSRTAAIWASSTPEPAPSCASVAAAVLPCG